MTFEDLAKALGSKEEFVMYDDGSLRATITIDPASSLGFVTGTTTTTSGLAPGTVVYYDDKSMTYHTVDSLTVATEMMKPGYIISTGTT